MTHTVDSATPASGPISAERMAAVQKRTMTVLIITQIVGTLGVGVAPTIGVLIAAEVTQNEMWAGLARTSSTLGAALFGLPLGSLAAKYGRRFAMSSGWWIAAVGTLMLIPAAQFNLIVPLFAGLLCLGAGMAVSLQARFAATDLAVPNRRARSLAMIVWVGTIGSVIGPNMGVPGEMIGNLVGLNVYAGSFVIATAFLTVAGLLIFLLLRPDPLKVLAAATGTRPPQRRQGNRIKAVIAELKINKPARIAFLTIVFGQIIMVSVMTMTPVHIANEGHSIALVGITISIHVLGMFAFAPVVGMVTDRMGHRTSIFIGIGVYVVSLVLGATMSGDMNMIMVSLFLLGLGWSFVNVAASALFSASLPTETRATSQGGADALSNLFGAAAAFAAGPLLAISSFGTLSVIAMAFLVPLVWLMSRPIPVSEHDIETRS